MYFLSQICLLAAIPPSGYNPWEWLKYGFTLCLEYLFDFTHMLGIPSYALAILFFTIFIKLATQPLMNKQLRSSRQMAKIQPQLQELQKKYAGNQQKIQQETMKLYKEVGFSPFGGCLPLLIQMPIMIALFQALRGFVPSYPEYYTFFWVKNLGDLSSTYPGLLGWVFPVIVGGATFLQQYLSIANKKDQTQKMMLYIMPVMFGWFTRNFPAFLALYWTYYSLVGAVIQIWLNKRWAADDAREEAERLAREEEERKLKKVKKAEQKGKVFVEDDIDEQNEGKVVTVGGVEYILPYGYTLREKKVRAHPYSDEMETVTMAIMPDGREKPVTSLKRNAPPTPSLADFGLGFGKKKQ